MNRIAFFPKSPVRASLLASALFVGLSATAFSQELILTYDFTGEDGDQISTAASMLGEGIAAGTVSRGGGLIPNTGANSLNSRGWNSLESESDYVSIQFTVEPGFSLDLTEFQIRTSASPSGPGHLGLFYSGDDFTENLHTINQPDGNLDSEINLSSLTELTDEVEFRIVALSDTRADGTTGIHSAGTFRLANYIDGVDTGGIHFHGTVIPEPSTCAVLLGVFVLMGAMLCRRRVME